MEFMVIVHLYSGGRTGTYQRGLLPKCTIHGSNGIYYSNIDDMTCFFRGSCPLSSWEFSGTPPECHCGIFTINQKQGTFVPGSKVAM